MKPHSPELRALYATRQFISADLYTFSGGNLGSTVLRWCSGDADLTVNGQLYASGRSTGPYFDRVDNKAKCHWKIGTEVDTLIFDCIPGTFQLFGVSLQLAAKLGYFDGATLLLERCVMPLNAYGDTSRGTVRHFLGRIADIDMGRSLVTFSVNSHLELLNIQLPRNLYQAPCVNNLGDTACGVNLASYEYGGTVVAGSNPNAILTDDSPFTSDASGVFAFGSVVFLTGVNKGLSMQILANAAGTPAVLVTLFPFPSAPAAGDTFVAFFGCDKTQGGNGCAKFSNLPRYRGEILVPTPTSAI